MSHLLRITFPLIYLSVLSRQKVMRKVSQKFVLKCLLMGQHTEENRISHISK